MTTQAIHRSGGYMTTRKRRADGTIGVRVDLKPPHADMFIEIREKLNLTSDAEVIRYCISQTSTGNEFKLEDPYWNSVRHFLQYDIVKRQFNIYDVKSLINKALDEFFKTVENDNESILSFDVLNHLTDTERDIAIEFTNIQEKTENGLVTAEKLVEKIEKRNTAQIAAILDDFVKRGILSKIVNKNKIYYHAKSLRKY